MDSLPKNQNMSQGVSFGRHKSSVHRVLAHSYFFFFLVFLLAVLLNVVYPIRIFSGTATVSVGLILLLLASLLIIWAQKTSRHLETEKISKETFCRGPYNYSRSPTHWGLFALMLGFGLMANSFFVVVFSFIAFITTRLFFLKMEESLLAEKYGEPYLEYKRSVRL